MPYKVEMVKVNTDGNSVLYDFFQEADWIQDGPDEDWCIECKRYNPKEELTDVCYVKCKNFDIVSVREISDENYKEYLERRPCSDLFS